jgi:acetyltransferase EpsM
MSPRDPASPAVRPLVRGRDPAVRPLVVIGGGQHARVVIDAARSRPDAWRVAGFVDPSQPAEMLAMGVAHLGDDEAFLARLASLDPGRRPVLVLGIGGMTDVGMARPGAPDRTRRRLAERYGAIAEWATVVHAAARVSPEAAIGPGTVVMAGAVVNPGAAIGRHAVVNTGAIVEHDVAIGDFAQLAPASAVGGGSRIGAGAFVGLGARVRDHVSVGEGAIVAMGAAVVGDVPPGSIVGGVPARSLGDAGGHVG